MKIYLDSADCNEIREAMQMFEINGVTTNPIILARTNAPNPADRLAEIKSIIGSKYLFVQLTALESETSALNEAWKIKNKLGSPIFFKIPAAPEYYHIMKSLREKNYLVCATAVYTVSQAVLAAKCGAVYIAPYVSHIDNMSLDGPELASQMQKTLALQGYDAHVLGASFRTASQVEKLMEKGVYSATVTFEMLKTLSASLYSDKEIDSFNSNWGRVYGEKKLVDFF